MTRTILSAGCSFTWGHELSDDGLQYSQKTWAARLAEQIDGNYFCVARAGSGNSGIARRVFDYIGNHPDEDIVVMVMWSFLSRYDWAMPRHKLLENTRWASITPWDTQLGEKEAEAKLNSNPPILQTWKTRQAELQETGVRPFADALYKHAANQYHEVYDTWKNIVWLQNILEKKNIKYFFTLADNTIFYNEFEHHKNLDGLMSSLHREINTDNWFSFGERMMGFNQWATLNDYAYGTTHPLDAAHKDAAKLMTPKFKQIITKETT